MIDAWDLPPLPAPRHDDTVPVLHPDFHRRAADEWYKAKMMGTEGAWREEGAGKTW